MMKEEGEDKQVLSERWRFLCGRVCKYICMFDLFHPWSINRNVIPPSVSEIQPEGQPLNLVLTSEVIGVKYGCGKLCVCVWVHACGYVFVVEK